MKSHVGSVSLEAIKSVSTPSVVACIFLSACSASDLPLGPWDSSTGVSTSAIWNAQPTTTPPPDEVFSMGRVVTSLAADGEPNGFASGILVSPRLVLTSSAIVPGSTIVQFFDKTQPSCQIYNLTFPHDCKGVNYGIVGQSAPYVPAPFAPASAVLQILVLDRAVTIAAPVTMLTNSYPGGEVEIVGFGAINDIDPESVSDYITPARFGRTSAEAPDQTTHMNVSEDASTRATACRGDVGGAILDNRTSSHQLIGVITQSYCTQQGFDATAINSTAAQSFIAANVFVYEKLPPLIAAIF